jgi:hypothetical protein
MPRKVRNQKLRAEGGSHNHVHLLEYLCRQLHCGGPGAIGLDVLHRRNEARSAKRVRPVVFCLLRQQLVSAAAR